MSKLDGNERWKGKMLLTEHQEQYESRNNKGITGPITNDELTMIRDLIMYPHMLTMCEKSLVEIKNSSNIFKRYFEQFIQMNMDMITKDLFQLRRETKNRNIKVFEDETIDGIIYHKYICRGYENKFGIVRETLRSEISVRMAKYASSIFNPLSKK